MPQFDFFNIYSTFFVFFSFFIIIETFTIYIVKILVTFKFYLLTIIALGKRSSILLKN